MIISTQRQQSARQGFLGALRFENIDVTPVWLMRQAGRYLPEYRRIREKIPDFLTLCQTPELACEVTLQPLQRYSLDAAILFSDILTIPDALGCGVHFVQGEGPRMARPIRSTQDVDSLPNPVIAEELSYVMDTVKLIKNEIGDFPLIGFSGSPWTLASYMIQGSGSKDFMLAKSFLYQQTESMHDLLTILANAVTDYLSAQIAAGVDVVMLFDTWGGLLTPSDYEIFSLNYMKLIITNLAQHSDIPIILFTKGGGLYLDQIITSGCDCIGLDWTMNIHEARKQVGKKVALQGNLDPAILMADSHKIREEVAKILASYGHGSGHIFNLGHGISQHTPPDAVSIFVDAVHELSQNYHQ